MKLRVLLEHMEVTAHLDALRTAEKKGVTLLMAIVHRVPARLVLKEKIAPYLAAKESSGKIVNKNVAFAFINLVTVTQKPDIA